jgi:hypothetical protein
MDALHQRQDAAFCRTCGRFRLHRLLMRDPPIQIDGGEVGEILQQTQLVRGPGARRRVGDDEGADDVIVDGERHGGGGNDGRRRPERLAAPALVLPHVWNDQRHRLGHRLARQPGGELRLVRRPDDFGAGDAADDDFAAVIDRRNPGEGAVEQAHGQLQQPAEGRGSVSIQQSALFESSKPVGIA